MRFPRQARPFRGQLDALPFVGVLFLLVIFLLLHSSFISPPGVRIQLPESAGTVPGVTNALLTVAVDARGQVYFEHQLAREEDLERGFARAVQRNAGAVTLVLMADRNVPNEVLVRLVALAHAAGIRDALLATRPPPVVRKPADRS